MIDIRHKVTGEVLFRVDAPKLTGANLSRVRLSCADLRGAKLREAALQHTQLEYADLREAVPNASAETHIAENPAAV